jgi:hypothetical protein
MKQKKIHVATSEENSRAQVRLAATERLCKLHLVLVHAFYIRLLVP